MFFPHLFYTFIMNFSTYRGNLCNCSYPYGFFFLSRYYSSMDSFFYGKSLIQLLFQFVRDNLQAWIAEIICPAVYDY